MFFRYHTLDHRIQFFVEARSRRCADNKMAKLMSTDAEPIKPSTIRRSYGVDRISKTGSARRPTSTPRTP
jgi:hypothetical protein